MNTTNNAFDITVEALRKQGLNAEEILTELGNMFRHFSTSFEKSHLIEDETNEEDVEENLKKHVEELLNTLGVPSHLTGYHYIVSAVMLCLNLSIPTPSKNVLPEIAKQFDSTQGRVERNIRHAIAQSWKACPKDIIAKFFGNTISYDKPPHNYLFISTIVSQFSKSDTTAPLTQEEIEMAPLTQEEKEERIKALLFKIGIPSNLIGYSFIIKAIPIYQKVPKCTHVYTEVAKIFNASASTVNSQITHAITYAVDNNAKEIYEIFGNTISPTRGMPTNHQFLAKLEEVCCH